MSKITRVGVDIAKKVFHVHGVDRHDQPQWTAKLSRDKWLDSLCKKVPAGALVAMESCASSHHWARQLQSRGYVVKLIAAKYVKPYVKTNKNDTVDAEAICEAADRPSMRFVAHKTAVQQDGQATHRIRSELIQQRTAKANQIRGLVGEYGVIAPVGIKKLRIAVPDWLEDAENGLSDYFRTLLIELWRDLQYLDERIEQMDKQILKLANDDPVARRLLEIRGVGPLCATALSNALGDGSAFNKGRDFAVALGLTPRQYSTGGREKLLGISKRGDTYLRSLLVHGARSVVNFAKNKDDNLSRWINSLSARKHYNVVTIALANKTARIAWALATQDAKYEPTLASSK